MRFMLHHHARCAVVIVVSIAMFSVGCRSTRNGLSRVPGMGWVASDDVESFPGWEADSETASLPTPSSDATPQVVSGGGSGATTEKSSGGYPTTGYPSPYDDKPDVAKTGKYPTDTTDSSEPYSNSAVGSTQKGFYDENYATTDEPANSPPTTTDDPNQYDADPYGDYAAPYGADDYSTDSVAADADPRFEQLGQDTADATADAYAMDPADDLGDSDPSFRDGYDRLKDDVGGQIREGAAAIGDTAERVQDEVNGFAREQVDSLKDSVESGYDNISDAARDTYNTTVESAQSAIGQVYGREDDLSGQGSLEDAAPSFDAPAADSYDQYSAEPPASDTYADGSYSDAPQDLAPPTDYPAESLDSGYGQGSTGAVPTRRTPRPWRPGSTGAIGKTNDDQSHYASPQGQITPASYPPQERMRVPNAESSFPNEGWESEANHRRLSPTQR